MRGVPSSERSSRSSELWRVRNARDGARGPLLDVASGGRPESLPAQGVALAGSRDQRLSQHEGGEASHARVVEAEVGLDAEPRRSLATADWSVDESSATFS